MRWWLPGLILPSRDASRHLCTARACRFRRLVSFSFPLLCTNLTNVQFFLPHFHTLAPPSTIIICSHRARTPHVRPCTNVFAEYAHSTMSHSVFSTDHSGANLCTDFQLLHVPPISMKSFPWSQSLHFVATRGTLCSFDDTTTNCPSI